jgi:putative pyruvate formate lyase activating enzyme
MGADPFVAEDWEPAYLGPWRRGHLADRVEAARAELRECRACPRDCGVDRLAGKTAVCRVGRHALVASAFPHHGEEDCLRGRRGSGTIFFSGCNLRCAFCQNWDISQRLPGEECPAEELAGLMLALQARGCHNVNLVTPEHVAPQVVEAIALAVPRGLRLPIVYNTGGYDGLSALGLMEGLVDIYMPDFKFWESATARRLAGAADYPEQARAALSEMHRQVGVLRLGPDRLARRGVLVRHLVLPGRSAESAAIFAWLAAALSPDTYLNIMGQYRPDHRVPGADRFRDIDRRPLPEEMSAAYEAARGAGLWRFAERS